MFQTTLPILHRNFENTSSDLSALDEYLSTVLFKV